MNRKKLPHIWSYMIIYVWLKNMIKKTSKNRYVLINTGRREDRKEGRKGGRKGGRDWWDGWNGWNGWNGWDENSILFDTSYMPHTVRILRKYARMAQVAGTPNGKDETLFDQSFPIDLLTSYFMNMIYYAYIYIMYNSMCIYKHLCMFQRRLICIYLHAYPDTLHINVCMYTCIHGHGTHPKLTFLPWSAWLGKTYLSAMIYIIYTYCVNMFVSYIQCIYIYYML